MCVPFSINIVQVDQVLGCLDHTFTARQALAGNVSKD
jgi:hypothetical protein